MTEKLKEKSLNIYNFLNAFIDNYENNELRILKDDWKSFHEFLNNHENEITIMVTGLVKAGKSSFLNAIFDKRELFPTGASRVTSFESKKIWKGDNGNKYKISFVDTPGIDSLEKDEKIAKEALKRAHIVLFIHNINQGELDSREMKHLSELCQELKNPEKHIIFVLTNSDRKEENYITNIYQKILEQIKKYQNFDFKFFITSSERYFSGIEKDKQILKEKSNIPNFKNFIENELEKIHKSIINLPNEKYENLSIKTKNIFNKINLQIEAEIMVKQNDLQKSLNKIQSFEKRWEEKIRILPYTFENTCKQEIPIYRTKTNTYDYKPSINYRPSKTSDW